MQLLYQSASSGQGLDASLVSMLQQVLDSLSEYLTSGVVKGLCEVLTICPTPFLVCMKDWAVLFVRMVEVGEDVCGEHGTTRGLLRKLQAVTVGDAFDEISLVMTISQRRVLDCVQCMNQSMVMSYSQALQSYFFSDAETQVLHASTVHVHLCTSPH